MKEEKVYMSKLPCQCMDCQFAYSGRCQLNGENYCIENCRRGDCPLIDIKTHDRELVNEACEKIRSDLQSGLKKFKPKPDDVLTQFIYNLDNKLDQIEKEFEK